MLLACAPLFDALRSVGRRGGSVVLILPLAMGALRQLAYGALDALNLLPPSWDTLPLHFCFFDVETLASGVASLGASIRREFVYEAAKWLACLAIAIRLSVAQFHGAMPPLRTRGDGPLA